jgi:hypothetical protein
MAAEKVKNLGPDPGTGSDGETSSNWPISPKKSLTKKIKIAL